MAVYELHYEQKIPVALTELWDFIASPHNLKLITPEYMNFKVHPSKQSDIMYPGMMITYKVSPVLGIPLDWCTEITHVEHMKFFVDEQREGPYSIWHHQHHLKEIEGGVMMTDIVHYKVPFGFIGKIANQLFIKKQLKQIFDYRYKKVEELFGKMKD